MSAAASSHARRGAGAAVREDRIASAVSRAAAESRAAFIPFLTAGDPSADVTVETSIALERAGADVLELGVPFSDPIADGPVLQRSAARALAGGASLSRVFEIAGRIRAQTGLALVLFSYLNPLLRSGLAESAAQARRAGFDGVLVTDLPPEEAPAYRPALRAAGLDTIFLVSPTSPPRRMLAAARLSTGFLYVVSRSGITGARTALDPELARTVARARRAAPRLPRAIGFGISTPEAARLAAGMAEGVIVGSALVGAGEEALLAGRDPAAAVARLAARLAAACARTRPESAG
jgi:tryptophan synthase alpha chain